MEDYDFKDKSEQEILLSFTANNGQQTRQFKKFARAPETKKTPNRQRRPYYKQLLPLEDINSALDY